MGDIRALLPEIQAVVAQYLDGVIAYDYARNQLANLVKRAIPPREALEALLARSKPVPGRLQIKVLTLAEWFQPRDARIFEVNPLDVAPGRTDEEVERAQDLVFEALQQAYDAA